MLAQDVEGQTGKQGAGTTHDWVEDTEAESSEGHEGETATSTSSEKAGKPVEKEEKPAEKKERKPIEESDQVDTDSRPPPG